MKKAFSLIEVVISIAILSVAMVALLQIKSDNIFLMKKANEKQRLNDTILMAADLKEAGRRNFNTYLSDRFIFENEELRKEFKKVKIEVKDKKIGEQIFKNDFISLNISKYTTTYRVKDEIKKNIYSFKLGL